MVSIRNRLILMSQCNLVLEWTAGYAELALGMLSWRARSSTHTGSVENFNFGHCGEQEGFEIRTYWHVPTDIALLLYNSYVCKVFLLSRGYYCVKADI